MRHQHIAVGDDDPRMSGNAPALGHIVQLRICADAILTDQHPDSDIRMSGHQVFDQRQYRIGCGSDAEQDFVARVIELECRSQRFRGEVVDTAQRAHQAYRRIPIEEWLFRSASAQARCCDCNARNLDGAYDD